jgi:hypothetical protein
MKTVKINNGREVTAKESNGELCAKTYANRSAAHTAAEKLGDDFEVIKPGRPWYVAKKVQQ